MRRWRGLTVSLATFVGVDVRVIAVTVKKIRQAKFGQLIKERFDNLRPAL